MAPLQPSWLTPGRSTICRVTVPVTVPLAGISVTVKLGVPTAKSVAEQPETAVHAPVVSATVAATVESFWTPVPGLVTTKVTVWVGPLGEVPRQRPCW